jgi:outer membrane protein assembly factor BamB
LDEDLTKGDSMKRVFRFVMLCFVLAGSAGAADWPQFCGPQRDNLSAETGLKRSWPAGGPEVLWTVDVTTGFAGPAIKDGKVYLLEHTNNVSRVLCLSVDSGKELWRAELDDPGELKNKKFPGTRGTPTVTDDALYAVTLYGTVFCVDLKSQKVTWQHSMASEFGKQSDTFGFAQSPLLIGDLVVIAPLTKTHGVVALDRKSGAIQWTSADFSGDGFVSPSLIKVNGQEQILMVAGGEREKKPPRRKKGAPESDEDEEEDAGEESAEPAPLRPTVVFALSPKDGSLLWSYDQWSCITPIPHPIMTGKDTLFITSGYKSVSTLIRIKGNDVSEVWKTEDAATWIEQPLLVDGSLFVGGTTKRSNKGLVCIDLDGEVQWDTNQIEGAPTFDHLNMIAADGMLIGLDGNSGVLHLIEATPKKFNELASAGVLAEKGQTWAPIALSDGKLLVRDHNQMKCLNLK